MEGYFTFVPSFLQKEEYTITLPDKSVILTGLYPLYKEEIELFRKIGLKEFGDLETLIYIMLIGRILPCNSISGSLVHGHPWPAWT